MRRSTLQFRRLQYSSLFALLSILLCTSCELVSSREISDVPSRTLIYMDSQESSYVMIDPDQCPHVLSNVYFDFSSPYGHHSGKISFAGGATHVEIDENKYHLLTEYLFTPEETQEICHQTESGSKTVHLSNKKLAPRFTKLVEKAAPYCKFTFKEDGLWCHLHTESSYAAGKKVKTLESNLFRYRQRHPYLLARRIALTRKIYEAMKRPTDSSIDELCQIRKLSNPLEVPLPMATELWNQKVCASDVPKQEIQIALSASFHDAYEELQFLLKIFRKTKTGVLTLRIPSEKAPSKDFWVKLKPLSIEIENVATNTCYWHPLYKQQSDLVLYSNLIGKKITPLASCDQSLSDPKTLEKALANHVTYSVCSETEFAISNGRGKVLALPKGTYSYELRQHYGLFSSTLELDPSSLPMSTGSISWSRRRPYPTIRSF